ncbi:MAG: transport between ER and Golgi ATPase protein [Vezdaea aestivalis]|nr:MAG: transport between ER and Golgi ATPase protein [Vezdaea aestivalis]
MFNRDNFSVPNPFGQRTDSSDRPQPRAGYINPNTPFQGRQAGHQNQRTSGGYDQPTGYGGSQQNQPPPSQRGRDQSWTLQPAKSPADIFTFGNLAAISPMDFRAPNDGNDLYLLLNDKFVLSGRPYEGFPPGKISLSEPQRSWMRIALTENVHVRIYNPFAEGDSRYLGSMTLEVGFAGRKSTEMPYDQDEMSSYFIHQYQNQIFAPGQKILMDNKSIPMMFTVKTVQLVDLRAEKSDASSQSSSFPDSRGILTSQTFFTFFKDPKSPINLKASSRRPAANSIIQPDFKFENMGIGGLDNEFAQIFRRAFASRIMPPGLIEKMGIQHVKGILLFGPPGTGKTLIARQIGKMLNAREPKVINGPEVLNKFVGQSEENVRKMFADAEKEYKEKGDESGLHIIIFDELDAVCKQRGSGGGGGTGVGDSVVNQLLSKLDGVDQLNNILLIGMTNRKDMIDDALLRPGRLEVHVEISLPDEEGRQQIFKIHTSKMRSNNVIDQDVDIHELAHLTKNFSGAEIGGVVKSASSYAFQKDVKIDDMVGVSKNIENLKVTRADFLNALNDVKAAFGASEEELNSCLEWGIIHYSPTIQAILDEGKLFVKQVRQDERSSVVSLILHGPSGSGKTALAAKIALDSGFPFIKLISANDMREMGEVQKAGYINKVFNDAYKSPLNIIVIDNIERILDWVPIGPRFSNVVLQILMVLLQKKPPKGRRLLIIGTTSMRSELMQLDIFGRFESNLAIPNVNNQPELDYILRECQMLSPNDASRALDEIRHDRGSNDIGVGIKTILNAMTRATLDDTDVALRFASEITREMVNSGAMV